jgi:hypothetical protein
MALIVGSLGSVVTMVLHPVATNIHQLVRLANVAIGTHTLALACMPLIFLGLLGLYERVKRSEIAAPAALVAYGYGVTAVMCAAVINGLAAPAYATRFADDPAAATTLPMVLHYGGYLNAAFAKIFMVASSVSILCWSAAILRTRALPRWVAGLGCVIGVASLVGLVGGVVNTSVHGFGHFVLGCSAWFIVVGILICQEREGSRESGARAA